MTGESKGKRNNRNRRFNRRKNTSNNASSSTSKTSTTNSRSKEYKFYLHDSQNRKNAESFGKIKEAIINKIQRTFDHPLEIVQCLRENKKPTFTAPEPGEVEGVTPEERALSTKKVELIFHEKFKWHMRKQDEFDVNFSKAFAMIWEGYCTAELRREIKEMPDWDQGNKVMDNPLRLLEKVENLMHTPEKAKYPVLTIIEVLWNFLRTKQKESEDLLDYLSRFKSERDVVFRLLGRNFLDGFSEALPDYAGCADADDERQFKKKELEKLVAVLFLRNSDPDRYGELLTDYRRQYANDFDVYPKTLEGVINVMRQMPPKKKKSQPKSEKPKDKANDETLVASMAQDTKKKGDGDAACYCCAKKDCRLGRCPKKDTLPVKEWHNPGMAPMYLVKRDAEKEKGQSHATADNHTATVTFQDEVEDEDFNTALEFMDFHQVVEKVHATHGDVAHDEILDSGSTITLSKDKSAFVDLEKVRDNVIMRTNIGSKPILEEGKWKNWGKSYHVPSAITNIVSMSDAIRKGYRIVMDSDRSNCFYVIDKNGMTVKFPCVNDLYVCSPDKPVNWRALRSEINMSTDVEGFTQREVDRARAARKFYHDMNAENISNMKTFIRTNQAKNIPIATEDFALAERVFGKDVPTCKGKWVRPKAPVVRQSNTIDLPRELRIAGMELELAIDVVYINKEAFLHGIDRRIRCPTIVVLGTRAKGRGYNKEILAQGIDVILRFYNRADVTITKIHADNEFKPVLEELTEDWTVAFNFAHPGEHVPDIERENRTLQDRFRVNLYRLPYTMIPRTMIRYLGLRITKNRSLFPRKNGISKHYSPFTIIKGKTIDFKKEYKFSFGDYVQANHRHEIKNNNFPRSVDAIYLRADPDEQGGHQVMDLATGKMIRRPLVEKMKTTKIVKDRVEKLAHRQGYRTLKFFNRSGKEEVLVPIDQLLSGEVNLPEGPG